MGPIPAFHHLYQIKVTSFGGSGMPRSPEEKPNIRSVSVFGYGKIGNCTFVSRLDQAVNCGNKIFAPGLS
jgi:hypothetical protein